MYGMHKVTYRKTLSGHSWVCSCNISEEMGTETIHDTADAARSEATEHVAAAEFWDGLTPGDQAEIRKADRPSGRLLRRLADAGLLYVGQWPDSADPPKVFYKPPALRAMIERKL